MGWLRLLVKRPYLVVFIIYFYSIDGFFYTVISKVAMPRYVSQAPYTARKRLRPIFFIPSKNTAFGTKQGSSK